MRLNKEQEEFAVRLESETGMSPGSSRQSAILLGELAAKHWKLSLMGLEDGLTGEQKAAFDSLERQILAACRGVDGIKGVVFGRDSKESTVGLAFDSGASNSIGGVWKIPVKPGALDALAHGFWRQHVPYDFREPWGGKHGVGAVLDALYEQTLRRGGSPSVREISEASIAVANMVAAYSEVRAAAVDAGMSHNLSRAIGKMDAAVALVEGAMTPSSLEPDAEDPVQPSF